MAKFNDSNDTMALQVAQPRDRALAPSYLSPAPQIDFEQEDGGIPISQYLWVIRRHLWKILAFVAVCVLLTFLVSARQTPIYESTASLEFDRNSASGVVGDQANRGTSYYFEADQYIATQIRVLQSDSVLRPVAFRYKLLDHEGQTRDLDETRRAIAEKGPVTLRRLRVTRPPNTFLLQVAYRSSDPDLAAQVANAIADSYVAHTYTTRLRKNTQTERYMQQQMEELQAKVERSGRALADFERAMGMTFGEEKTGILAQQLLQLNTEFTNAQADRMKKEAAWNSAQSGQLATVQISEQGQALARLNEKLNEAKSDFAKVKSTYGANHPEYRKLSSQVTELQKQFDDTRQNISSRIEAEYRQAQNRETMVKQSVDRAKADFDRLNSRSSEYQRLKREAEADRKLYEELVRRIREVGINSQFQDSTIKITDQARPGSGPVFPNVTLNVALAFVLSSILGVAAAVLSDVLDTTVRDPEQTSRFLRTDVIGTLPAVKNSSGSPLLALAPAEETEAAGAEPGGLVKRDDIKKPGYGYGYGYRSISSYEEAIRTLRNSILLGDFERSLRSMLVTSASPGEGKSTTAVHLAIAHAQQGKKTLIIDADLRRPTLHKKLGLTAGAGLSDVLTGNADWKDVIIEAPNLPTLHVVPSGPPSRRASDLIGPMMVELLDRANREYDLVMVDAPPLLGFAEPLQIATVVDGVLVVTRAGETKRKAVANVIQTLNRLRANVLGVVLNQVRKEMSDHYYYYGHYRKYYGQDADKAS